MLDCINKVISLVYIGVYFGLSMTNKNGYMLQQWRKNSRWINIKGKRELEIE